MEKEISDMTIEDVQAKLEYLLSNGIDITGLNTIGGLIQYAMNNQWYYLGDKSVVDYQIAGSRKMRELQNKN